MHRNNSFNLIAFLFPYSCPAVGHLHQKYHFHSSKFHWIIQFNKVFKCLHMYTCSMLILQFVHHFAHWGFSTDWNWWQRCEFLPSCYRRYRLQKFYCICNVIYSTKYMQIKNAVALLCSAGFRSLSLLRFQFYIFMLLLL